MNICMNDQLCLFRLFGCGCPCKEHPDYDLGITHMRFDKVRIKTFFILIFLGVSLLGMQILAWASPGKMVLALDDGRFTVKGNQVPIADLLQEISEASGARIFLFDPIETTRINVDLEARDLQEVLRTILRGHNYALLFGDTEAEKGLRMMVAREHSELQPGQAVVTKKLRDGPSLSTRRLSSSLQRNRRMGSPNSVRRVTKRDFGRGSAEAGNQNSTMEQRKSVRGVRKTFETRSAASGQSSKEVALTSTEKTAGEQSQMVDAPVQTDASPSPSLASREDQIIQMIETLEWRIESGQSDRDYDKWAGIKGSRFVQHDEERLAYYEMELQRLNENDAAEMD
jgi:hypothetical protein